MFGSFFSTFWGWMSKSANETEDDEHVTKLDEYKPGYPKFTALIGTEKSFHICRRFSNLRSRLLLLKQDRLSSLEKALEEIDQEETAPLFLSSIRNDQNSKRLSILSKIDIALEDYDKQIDRNERILRVLPAKTRDISSLKNWVSGNACMARDETAYLAFHKDLMVLASSDDNAMDQFEIWLENTFIRFCRWFGWQVCSKTSSDPNVYIFHSNWIKRISRVLVALLITILFLSPIIVCNFLNDQIPRVVVIAIATVLVVTILSCLFKVKAMEVFAGGATYATILVVFVSTSGSGTSS